MPAWKQLSSDPWLISSVQGVTIPFLQVPVQVKEPRPFRLSEVETQTVQVEVEKFIEKGVIEEVQAEAGQVISNVFLRPKKDGGSRLILDLTWVNLHVEYSHFKMHSLQTALNMMRRNCWMGSIDLKDAYYSVPVRESHRKYLRFRWKGRIFQFTVLPNGLACAPRVFTKILSPVFAKLREEGLEGFPYIDDSFVVADSFTDCQNSLKRLGEKLSKLGFVVHPEKSIFTPTRTLVFMGFLLDSKEFRVFLTQDKQEKLIRAASQVVSQTTLKIREVAGLIGLIIAFSQAFSYAEAYVKNLERDKVQALAKSRGDFDAWMTLSQESRDEIEWWLVNIGKSGRPVRRGEPDLVVYTDASMDGWGAHIEDKTAGGRWSKQEASDHINVLELRAILLGLQSLCECTEKHIRKMSDNTTAIAYIKRHGGVRSEQCNRVAQDIWKWAEERQVWLSGAHIPSVENVVADYKSRHFADNLEWSLNDKLFVKIVQRFGKPDIDLFATRLNCKVDTYVSWHPEPNVFAVDAFSICWSGLKFYAFPPFSMVGQAIEKALEDAARGILVVPWWPTQPWWGRLVKLGLQHMRFRPKKKNLLPTGAPDNLHVLNNCPLGAFRF